MRLVFLVFLVFACLACFTVLAGCPSPRMPSGPPPEYEDPPPPSWLEAGAPAGRADAGTSGAEPPIPGL